MVVDDDMMVGFEPPSLASLRCDMMKKTGELDRENEFVPSRDLNKNLEDEARGSEAPKSEKKETKPSQPTNKAAAKNKPVDEDENRPIRDALSL